MVIFDKRGVRIFSRDGKHFMKSDRGHFAEEYVKIESSGLCRGVVNSYALSCFHEDVGLGNFAAIRHIKRTDAVIENCDPLGGNALNLL